MKMTRRQLRSLIMETINRRHLSESTQGNPIAGFELDGKYYTNQDLQSLGVEDEWWWSQAAAQGLWFSEDEAEARELALEEREGPNYAWDHASVTYDEVYDIVESEEDSE